MDDPLLQLKNVGKSFRSEHSIVTAFHDVSFDVKRGELVSIVGPSGCGKSTLLRMICGLESPTEGQIHWAEEQKTGTPRTFLVFQSFALYPWMTVEENIGVSLEMRGYTPQEISEKIGFAVAQVGLEGTANAYPSELSPASKQRVGIARALAAAPTLLCMDEPFSMLDILTERSLMEETLEIWERKDFPCESILMVMHSVPEAVYMSDKVVVLSAKPTRVSAVVPIALPRPRNYDDPEFQALASEILQKMG